MPPQTPGPKDQDTSTPQSGAGHVDFDKLLLPKKETPGATPQSAQRINAGALFEQEQSAALPAPPKPAPAPAPKEEKALVRPLQTYQGDIESLVEHKNISVVGIAAAEADKKPQEPELPAAYVQKSRRGLWLSIAALVLLAAVLGAGSYMYLRLQPVPVSEALPAPFISVDGTQTVETTGNDGRSAVMQKLVAARDSVQLSLGLAARIQVVKKTAAGDGYMEVGAPEFLQLLAPRVPLSLVRTLEPQMLLGIHSFAGNEPFLILRADSLETAYAGMLEWEGTVAQDLSPLFDTAAPPAAPAPVATTTATTTQATSTPAAPIAPRLSQSNFIDQVVENRDARVMLGRSGEPVLLWTMLDRNTIVITTNGSTLREVVSRLNQASVISLPAGQ